MAHFSPADDPPPPPRGRRLLGPEDGYPRVGEGSLVTLADATLCLAHDARRQPGDHDRACLRALRSRDRGLTWEAPVTLLEDPALSLLQPSFARLPDGDLGLTYSRLRDYRHADKVFSRSADEGRTWSPPVAVSQGECDYMTGAHDRLLVLPGGRLLAVLHGKVAVGPGEYDCELATYLAVSDDGGQAWRSCTPAGLRAPPNPTGKPQHGLWEASVVPLADDRLLLLGRTATGELWQAFGSDAGDTWTSAAPAGIANPLAPPRLTRAPASETLLLIRNPDVALDSGWHGGERLRLTVRTSTDGGQSWGPDQVLEPKGDPAQWFDYPFLLWHDGLLHLGYRAPRFGEGTCALYYQRRRWNGYSLLPA